MQNPHLIFTRNNICWQIDRGAEQRAPDNGYIILIQLPQAAIGHISGQRISPQLRFFFVQHCLTSAQAYVLRANAQPGLLLLRQNFIQRSVGKNMIKARGVLPYNGLLIHPDTAGPFFFSQGERHIRAFENNDDIACCSSTYRPKQQQTFAVKIYRD